MAEPKLREGNVKLFYSNVRSLNNKYLLQLFCEENHVDIVMLNETWLYPEITDEFILPNYNIFRKDRESRGGGVLIATKAHIKTYPINLEIKDFEIIAVKCKFGMCTCNNITWYNPPNSKHDVKQLFDFIKSNMPDSHYTIFAGDINCDKTTDSYYYYLKDNFNFLGLEVLKTKPTYPANQPKKSLDWFAINRDDILNSINVVNNIHENCDHQGFEVQLKFSITKQKKFKLIKVLTKSSYQKINEELCNIEWNKKFSDDLNINSLFDEIEKEVSKIIENKKTLKKFYLTKRFPKEIRKLCVKEKNTKLIQNLSY